MGRDTFWPGHPSDDGVGDGNPSFYFGAAGVTTLTYADDTKITMTKLTANSTTSAANSASQSYNFTERLIERQARMIAANAQPSLSVRAN